MELYKYNQIIIRPITNSQILRILMAKIKNLIKLLYKEKYMILLPIKIIKINPAYNIL
jgi:hypothetical protein